MWIKELKVHQFRNYNDKSFSFENRINLIYGNNGSGKTSLLEASYLLSLGKSFRTNAESTLIQLGKNNFFIKGYFETKKDSNVEIVYSQDKKKQIKINQKSIQRLSELVGLIHVVLLLHRDMDMIDRSPDLRRRFIDILFSQLNQEYLTYLMKYYKILHERNYYLKNNEQNDTLYISLTKNLVEYGSEIIFWRLKYIKEFSNLLKVKIKDYSVDILKQGYMDYYSNVIKESQKEWDRAEITNFFYERLEKNKEYENRVKMTVVGPHRDDLIFYKLEKQKLIDYTSTGERRLFVLFLKLAEIDFMSTHAQEDPVILIDDITLDLDKKNTDFFLGYIKSMKNQVLITTVDEKEYQFLKDINKIIL